MTAAAPPIGFRIQAPMLVPEIFDQTMSALEAGLKVADVATFDVLSCQQDEDATEVLRREDLAQFDAIPVTNKGPGRGCSREVGPAGTSLWPDATVVRRDPCRSKRPLKTFIPRLADERYRLVVRNSASKGS